MRRLRDFIVFIAAAGLCAFAALFIFGKMVNAQIADEINKIVVRDVLGQRVHRLSGMVMVENACHDLLVRSEEIDTMNYRVVFTTWIDPNRVCGDDQIPRQFHLTVFAPSTGVSFQATLDGISVPIEVIPTIE